MSNNWRVDTDDYDLYNQGGDTITARPGSPTVDEQGHLHWDPQYFPMSAISNSTMDQDPNNTGPTNDFWTAFPISIDINGYIFYNGENTGINVRGPAGASRVVFENLTPAQIEALKGQSGTNGVNGTNGRDGIDGANGMNAYELWLEENGWLDHPELHPIEDFFAYLANLEDAIIQEGTGNGSLILNYRGTQGQATGAGAIASGYNTLASGQNSFAAGNGTVAAGANQIAIGTFNETKTNSVLEIGNGADASHRSNAFTFYKNGNLEISGDITDGSNNVLSNKVDKVLGKQLSTYDFNATYKNFIDNYSVDQTLNVSSTNPIANSAVATAIQELNLQNGKPQQYKVTNQNNFYGIFHPYSLSTGTMNSANFTDNLLYNPKQFALKTLNNTVDTTDKAYIIAYGEGLTTTNSYQTVIGKYNSSQSGDLFEIGNGIANTPSNAFRVNQNGNVYAGGTFIDASGNSLSGKQDTLTFDEEPTENSTGVVNSGDLYDYLVSHGIDPEGGIVVPEITTLRNQVAALSAQVTALAAVVSQLVNPREFVDDTYTYKTWILGVDRNDLYIRLKEDPEEQEEEEEEEENEE